MFEQLQIVIHLNELYGFVLRFFFSFLHLLAWVGDTQIRVSPSQQSVEPVIIQINKTLNTSAYHIFEPGR